MNMHLYCNVKPDPECALQDESIDTTFSFSSQVFMPALYRNSAYAAESPRAASRYAQNVPRHITELSATSGKTRDHSCGTWNRAFNLSQF